MGNDISRDTAHEIPTTTPSTLSPDTLSYTDSHFFNLRSRVASLQSSPESPPDSPNTPTALYQTRSRSLHSRQRSSLLIVRNGVTGKYISSRICKIAAMFWRQHIDNLPFTDRLELGCSIFFGMMSSDHEMSALMKKNMPKEKTYEKTGLKYLDMMGWLIRHLLQDNIDLFGQLSKLGAVHKAMGIGIDHYTPMLQAMHETFAYYFATKYTIEIKYAMDEIFSLTAQVMTGDIESHLKDLNQEFGGNDIPFLHSLDICLKSSIGREYLFRYLSQTWCDELVIFLQSLFRFKNLMTDKERYFVAKDMAKLSIEESAEFSLNLSYATRFNTLNGMVKLEEVFLRKENLEICTEFFAEVEMEVKGLVRENHWIKFVQEIEVLKLKSFNVEFDL